MTAQNATPAPQRSPSLTQQLQKRLSFVEGQVRGVRGMLENERDLAEILIQLRAIQSAVGAAAALIVEDGVIGQIKQSIRELLAACAGPCDSCDQLDQIMAGLEHVDYSTLVGQLVEAPSGKLRVVGRGG